MHPWPPGLQRPLLMKARRKQWASVYILKHAAPYNRNAAHHKDHIGERSFSALKYLEDYPKSTMGEVRLNGLVHIYNNKELN
jgi:hypothetical protein